ncbi:MAG: hypothetical protein K5766_02305 [Alphaproteobacteria bacterium]|nr:hypothetical protein [Alphaproteobacteria bacterium]
MKKVIILCSALVFDFLTCSDVSAVAQERINNVQSADSATVVTDTLSELRRTARFASELGVRLDGKLVNVEKEYTECVNEFKSINAGKLQMWTGDLKLKVEGNDNVRFENNRNKCLARGLNSLKEILNKINRRIDRLQNAIHQSQRQPQAEDQDNASAPSSNDSTPSNSRRSSVSTNGDLSHIQSFKSDWSLSPIDSDSSSGSSTEKANSNSRRSSVSTNGDLSHIQSFKSDWSLSSIDPDSPSGSSTEKANSTTSFDLTKGSLTNEAEEIAKEIEEKAKANLEAEKAEEIAKEIEEEAKANLEAKKIAKEIEEKAKANLEAEKAEKIAKEIEDEAKANLADRELRKRLDKLRRDSTVSYQSVDSYGLPLPPKTMRKPAEEIVKEIEDQVNKDSKESRNGSSSTSNTEYITASSGKNSGEDSFDSISLSSISSPINDSSVSSLGKSSYKDSIDSDELFRKRLDELRRNSTRDESVSYQSVDSYGLPLPPKTMRKPAEEIVKEIEDQVNKDSKESRNGSSSTSNTEYITALSGNSSHNSTGESSHLLDQVSDVSSSPGSTNSNSPSLGGE